jgi:hypothetical protein
MEEFNFTSIDSLFPPYRKDSDKINRFLYLHHSSFDAVTLIFIDSAALLNLYAIMDHCKLRALTFWYAAVI